jgi:putative nucleotidyltransferase with HDIG domain
MEIEPDKSKFTSLFESYYNSFKGLDANQQKNFAIKKNHSIRVAQLMEILAGKADFSEEVRSVVYATGLFHDIGRFEQFIKYNTFNDMVSFDHAAHSVEVVQNEGIFLNLPTELSEAVCSAIFQHNKAVISEGLPKNTLTLANLLRDADKLDIYSVLSDYYENPGKEPNHSLTWELPEGFKISEGVAAALLSKETVPKAELKNKLDLKVFQLSWVYDLNFKPSFRILSEKRYIDRIYATIPKSGKVIEYHRGLKIYIENKVNS